MDIEEKYNKNRGLISDGDLILFHGTGFVANVIQNCDKAYWNHVGVVVEKHGALFIVDANANGVQADRLSWRIGKYKRGGDFCIIHPIVKDYDDDLILQESMERLLKRSDDKWIKYDFLNGSKELLNRKFGWKLNIRLKNDLAICSSNVDQYAKDLDIMEDAYYDLNIVFPQDFLRYLNKEKVIILGT